MHELKVQMTEDEKLIGWNVIDADVYGFDFGGRESLPDSADLQRRADQIVPRTQDRRTAAAHLRHWR